MTGTERHATALIVTDGKIGDLVQCRGLAEAAGLAADEYVVRSGPPFTWFAPHLGLGPFDSRRLITPPHPDVAIASGRRAAAALRILKHASAGRAFTVLLKDARAGTGIADFIWVPEHDPLRGPNVMATLTSPHTLSPARIAARRIEAAADPRLAALARPLVTVLLGGPAGRNPFTRADADALIEGLLGLSPRVGAYLVTPSRRTPREATARIREALVQADMPHELWDGTGDNPYPLWTAAADALVVTGDSVNMVGEAAALGRAVFVHRPGALAPKIARFLDGMEACGATKPLAGSHGEVAFARRAPTDATPEIAAEARRRYEAHRTRYD